MTKKQIYEALKPIQTLAWRGDDHMGQEALFELQDKLAVLTLKLAQDTGSETDLVKTFPWLYSVREEV